MIDVHRLQIWIVQCFENVSCLTIVLRIICVHARLDGGACGYDFLESIEAHQKGAHGLIQSYL